jgi:hypothetical protein
MLRKIFGLALALPFAITLLLAVTGAIAALIGGLGGWDNIKTIGGVISGIGAIGFFAWLFVTGYFQLFDVVQLFTPKASVGPAQWSGIQTNNAQLKVSRLDEKEKE